MITIRQVTDIAYRPEGGPWYSENTSFEQALNTIATPENIRGYYPDLQAALVELVQEAFKGVEVLEITTKERAPLFTDPIY